MKRATGAMVLLAALSGCVSVDSGGGCGSCDPCSGGYAPLYREPLFTHLVHGAIPGRAPGSCPDYTALFLPACEQVCRDTVWLPQTLLLAKRQDMEDVAAALTKILDQ